MRAENIIQITVNRKFFKRGYRNGDCIVIIFEPVSINRREIWYHNSIRLTVEKMVFFEKIPRIISVCT